jgi:hypothetical protein
MDGNFLQDTQQIQQTELYDACEWTPTFLELVHRKMSLDSDNSQ